MSKIRIRKLGEKWVVSWGASASVEFPSREAAFMAAEHLWRLHQWKKANV
jgi:hypothetical protein